MRRRVLARFWTGCWLLPKPAHNDPQGVLLYKGGIDSIPSTDKEDIAKAENYIHLALQELAAGKPINKSATKPYGCSVKYAG